MQEIKDYNDKNKMNDIMNTTQSNYSNMLKRLQQKKSFSNFVITYYSIALIVYSLTAVFFPEVFDEKYNIVGCCTDIFADHYKCQIFRENPGS